MKPIAWVWAAGIVAASIGGAVFVTEWKPFTHEPRGAAVTPIEHRDPSFDIGMARLNAGDAVGAIDPLRAAVRLSTGAAEQDARWYLAVALERAGRPTDAVSVYDDLCRGAGARAKAACAAATGLRVR